MGNRQTKRFADISRSTAPAGIPYNYIYIWPATSKKEISYGAKDMKKRFRKCEMTKKRSKVVAITISEHLVEYGILPFLSADDLLRFKTVSKNWSALISKDTRFINLQSRRAPSGIAFATVQNDYMTRLYLDTCNAGTPILSRPVKTFGVAPITPYSDWICASLKGSCNGIVCLCSTTLHYRNRKLLVGNPNLNDTSWRWFPLPETTKFTFCPVFGLAVDLQEDAYSRVLPPSYYIVAPHFIPIATAYKFMLLSSSVGQWKLSSAEMVVLHGNSVLDSVSLYIKGSLYWRFRNRSCALWFDPKQERGGLQLLPTDSRPRYGAIGELNGRLSYATITLEAIEVWSHDHDSFWSKLHSVRLDMIPGCMWMNMRGRKSWEIVFERHHLQLIPFADGDVISFLVDEWLHYYDTATGKVTKRAKSYSCFRPRLSFSTIPIFPYKSSLIAL